MKIKEKKITAMTIFVTIMILLILAGITLQILLPNVTLTGKAEVAKRKRLEEEVKEKTQSMLSDFQSSNTQEKNLLEYFKIQAEKGKIENVKDNQDGTITITVKEYQVIINSNDNTIVNLELANGVEFDYTFQSYESNVFQIIIQIEEKENGINQIEMPEGMMIQGNGKRKVAIDYEVELGKEYQIKITPIAGEMIEKKIYIDKIPMALQVKVGDFIDYDAGTWSKEEIDILTNQNLYAGSNLPTNSDEFKFGGFSEGDNKNASKKLEENQNLVTGWRVLKINKDATIELIHAGITEAYYHPYGVSNGHKSEYILSNGTKSIDYNTYNPRDWSMYEDRNTNNFAIQGSSHCLTYQEGFEITNSKETTSNDLRNIGIPYWFTDCFDYNAWDYFGGLYSVDKQGKILGNSSACFGIRPVITLKSKLTITEGNGTENQPYKLEKFL